MSARVVEVEFDSNGPGHLPTWQLTIVRIPDGGRLDASTPRPGDIAQDVRIALASWASQ